MRRYRRHHLSDEVEEAIWNYAYGCTCLGMLEEFDGNEELYEAVDKRGCLSLRNDTMQR